MRKINKILYIVCSAIGISIFFLGCSFKSGVERKAWFRYASKYDQAMSKVEASGGALQDYNKLDKIGQKYLRAKQPTETEIISVLRSSNRRFQKIGLISISLRPIETNTVIEILFEFLRDQDPAFRWYTLESLAKFTKFPETRRADLGKQLLEIVKTRNDNELSPREFSLLAKFPSKDTGQFLTEQIMKEGKEKRIRLFRVCALRALKEMGNLFYDEAAEYVNKHGSPEIKEELWQWEKVTGCE